MGLKDWFRKPGHDDKFYKESLWRNYPKKRKVILNDLHNKSFFQDNPEVGSILEKYAAMTPEEIVAIDAYDFGDNNDLKCAPPEDIPYLFDLEDRLEKAFNFDPLDPRKTLGNHNTRKWLEWYNQDRVRTLRLAGIVKTYGGEHGHLLIDDLKENRKWKKYCDKPNGASKMKQKLTFVLDKFDFVKENRMLPEGFVLSAAKRAYMLGYDGMIIAHFHVEGQRYYYPKYMGKTFEIIILPAHQENVVFV